MPYNFIRIVMAFVIVFLSYLGSYIATFLLDKIGHLVSKTKTHLDDEIIAALKSPIRILFILGGLFWALYYLDRSLKIGRVSVVEIFIILGILFIAYTLKRIIAAILIWSSKSISPKTGTKIDDHLFSFVRKIMTILVYLIAFIIILDRLGIKIGPLLAGLGIAGLAVALALQDTLSNFFSGIHILADKPIRVGDFIKIDSTVGLEGIVKEIGWRSIRIETASGDTIIIPNSKIAQSTVINFSLPAEPTNIVINVSASYDSKVDEVEKLLVTAVNNVMNKNKNIIKEFEPIARCNNFGSSSLDFSIVYRIDAYQNHAEASSEIREEILKLFRKNKIEIPFPITTVQLKK